MVIMTNMTITTGMGGRKAPAAVFVQARATVDVGFGLYV
jgi:hypothetical protein